MKIVNATPDPDGYATCVTFDSPSVSVSRGPVDRIMTLLGRVRYLPGGMPLRIAAAGGPPIEVQGVEIRQIERHGEQVWAVVLVPEGVELRPKLLDEVDDLAPSSGWPPIDPNDGWRDILVDLQRDLAQIDPGLVVRQVKQKFGALEVWVEPSAPGLADAVYQRITAARELSARTCECCGAPGRIQQKPSGWYQALCDEHVARAATETDDEDDL